jgi:2-methylcitrate dehydratase PrpD
MTKYGSPGWQNSSAVQAVLLADMGYMGDLTLFDTENKPWKFITHEGWQPARVTDGLGEKWIFTRAVYKPYPCCRQLHTLVDCLRKIIDQNNIRAEDIASIKAEGHPHLEVPLFTNRELTNVVDIQFGLHYVLSMVAYRVPVGVEWQDLDLARSPKIQELMKKVSFKMHPNFEKEASAGPGRHIGKVEVVARGKTYMEERLYPRGTPGTEFALTDKELEEKFRHNASRILTEGKINGAVKAILELEKLENTRELIGLITR